MTFGATGFTSANREQLQGLPEWAVEGQATPGIRRGDLVLRPGMAVAGAERLPGTRRVSLGHLSSPSTATTSLNVLPLHVQHVG